MSSTELKTLPVWLTPRMRLLGVFLLATAAVSSSFYLELVEGYVPCIYCYVLRYLAMGLVVVSALALLIPNWTPSIVPIAVAVGLVGTGVSAYLIVDELFPNASVCTACGSSPIILGFSLYYYSLVFILIVLGLALTLILESRTA